MPQAPALAGSFDEPGDVGHDELGVVEPHHAEVGLQGGERVVGDLGFGGRDAGDQGALAGIGEAHQRHVGHELELEVVPALFARLTLLGERRGPAAVGQEPGVAPAALAPPAGHPPVAGTNQDGQHLALEVPNDCALGHLHDGVGAGGAVAGAALAVGPAGGPAKRVVLERQQRGGVVVRHQPHVAPTPSVATVRTAPGDMGLTAERHRAGPPVTRLDVQLGFVDESGHGPPA